MSFGPLLNLEQFQKFMKTIRNLTNRVEEAHTRHLQEVKSLEEQTRSVNASSTSSPQLMDQSTIGADVNVSFESLVQGGGAVNSSSDNDMFGALVNKNTVSPNLITPQQRPVTTNQPSSWSSPSQPAIVPSPMLLQQQTQPANNGWSANSSSTLQPSNTWNKPLAPATTATSTTSPSINWNTQQQQSNWSSSIKPISSPQQQQQQIPSLSSPPSFAMNQMSFNNNNNNNNKNANANYNALRSIPPNTTTMSAQPPSMMPLSSGMGLLPPIPSPSITPLKSNAPHVTKTNLHAFDPLG